MNNEIQFILYQLPDEDGKMQVVNYLGYAESNGTAL